jgi:hypothetical protein
MHAMPLVVYLDETGDHSLELIDRDFPVFGVVLLICDAEVYVKQLIPAVCQLKFDYFGHEGVVLHSREIRRAQGDFGFLTDPAKRPPFYERINRIMSDYDFQLVAAFIRKQRHKDKYGVYANHPYELALMFALERLLPLLESVGQTEVTIIAESRGKREDDELRLSFLEVINNGTGYVSYKRFRQVNFRLDFRQKGSNLVGTQIADLAAYPIARHTIDKDKDNRAFEIVKRKFYKGPGLIRGLKVFP